MITHFMSNNNKSEFILRQNNETLSIMDKMFEFYLVKHYERLQLQYLSNINGVV